MQAPFPVSSKRSAVTVGVSLGIAEGWRETPEALLHDADVALSRAKCTGKARAVRFTEAMQTAADERRALEADLANALARGQFFLHYQPTFSLDSGRITGVEALLRWRHPVRGLVMPDRFIPSLESTGLIVPVGRWVLEQACDQAAKWNSDGDKVVMAVNVSGHQLEFDGFVAEVEEQLKASGLDPHLLSLEITETVLMQDVLRSIGRLESLKATGVRLAVDDFGTGYSSIAYLQKFPIDVIKIDQSFVAQMTESRESAALVHALSRWVRHWVWKPSPRGSRPKRNWPCCGWRVSRPGKGSCWQGRWPRRMWRCCGRPWPPEGVNQVRAGARTEPGYAGSVPRYPVMTWTRSPMARACSIDSGTSTRSWTSYLFRRPTLVLTT